MTDDLSHLPMTNPRPTYFSDPAGHLVCWPYSVQGLHDMAARLGIKRCHYHPPRRGRPRSIAHYDIPKRRRDEIAGRTWVVPSRGIVAIARGLQPRQDRIGWALRSPGAPGTGRTT